MNQQEGPEKAEVPDSIPRGPSDSPVSRPDTGGYAHQELVAMMRRRRDAEEKLRQRQNEVTMKHTGPNGQSD